MPCPSSEIALAANSQDHADIKIAKYWGLPDPIWTPEGVLF